ncbi:MAG: hypothetical protein FJ319_11240 [SAR202 cluster bacterium]|nr:hypothetical protein [SAR202 cluster bacterium]
MLIVLALILALVPVIAILYPYLRPASAQAPEDESSTFSELDRRWDAAISGLKSAELEYSIGSLPEQDYRALREQYLTEAALVLKAMELEEQQETELLARVEREVRSVRERFHGAPQPRPSEAAGE